VLMTPGDSCWVAPHCGQVTAFFEGPGGMTARPV
jgi:hypothetical protein